MTSENAKYDETDQDFFDHLDSLSDEQLLAIVNPETPGPIARANIGILEQDFRIRARNLSPETISKAFEPYNRIGVIPAHYALNVQKALAPFDDMSAFSRFIDLALASVVEAWTAPLERMSTRISEGFSGWQQAFSQLDSLGNTLDKSLAEISKKLDVITNQIEEFDITVSSPIPVIQDSATDQSEEYELAA